MIISFLRCIYLPYETFMQSYSNEIKILSGTYKGKNIPVLNAKGLRPTSVLVRKVLFSWLTNDLPQARVLDLFAGSGILGYEAISNGAASLTQVELSKDVYENLKKFNSTFKVNTKISLFNQNAIDFINNHNDKYNVIFIDPPYDSEIYEEILSTILNRQLIDSNAKIYVEEREGSHVIVPGYRVIKEQQQGQVHFSLWQKSMP